jgi:hypothetical protein
MHNRGADKDGCMMPIGILILLIIIGAVLLLFHKSYAETSTYNLWVMRSRLEKPMKGFSEFILQ